VITPGSDADIFYITVTGTVHCRHRLRPLSGLCLVTSCVSYQGVIFVLHSRLTLSCRHRVLSTVVLKVRSRATQRCPRAVYRRERQGGYDRRYWRAWPLLVSRESYQTTKVELYQEHTRDRRRFTLLVTAVTWWDDRAGTNVLVVLTVVVDRGSVKS